VPALSTIWTLLDFLARGMALVLAVGSALAFIFKKAVTAWIDAMFKRRVDAELEILKGDLAKSLESVRADFAKQLEERKAALALDLEKEKRRLDEELRRDASLYDNNRSFYDVFYASYGPVLTELWALQNDFTAPLDKTEPGLGKKVRDAFVARVMGMLSEANQKASAADAYLDVDVKVRIAHLFKDLMAYITSGAQGEARLRELTVEHGMIIAELRLAVTRSG
jgi:hypothetical protein